MDPSEHTSKDKPVAGENWPLSLEATRELLKKAQTRLERYQAAIRLANIEIERRNRGLVALTTFTYQAGRTTSPTELLKLALVQALETLNTAVGAIILIDKETKELTLGVHKGLTAELTKILTGQQLDKGAMVLMPHLVSGSGALLEYENSDDKMERQLLFVSRLTSLVSLPLQLGPKLAGALLVGLQEKRTFTPAELYLLMALSQELAIALESIRLREGLWLTAESLFGGETDSIDLDEVDKADLKVNLFTPFELPTAPPTSSQPAEDDLEHLLAAMMAAEDEVQQQNTDLQTLNAIAEMMNRTLNLKDVLQSAVNQTKTILNVDAAWLYMVDATNHLEMRAHTGLSEAYVRGMQRLKADREIEGRTAAQNKPYFIESIIKDYPKHKIWVDREKLGAMATMPITRPDSQGQDGHSHVIGVLAVGKKTVQNHSWSPREIRMLTSIANQLALAISNARLYARLQEDEVGLRAGNEVLRTINDMLLEKNVFLEGFIQDDLIPALNVASPVLEHLLTEASNILSETQKQNLATLQKVIGRLNNLAQETGEVSQALDSAVDQRIDVQDQSRDYAGSAKPLRLEKKDPAKKPEQAIETNPGSTHLEKDASASPKKPQTKPTPDTGSKPMTFEEAVAAGLVPAHILDRE